MKRDNWNRFMFMLTVVLVKTQLLPCIGTPIGVCYGRNGNNLPSPKDVISLFKKNGIELIRLYEPNPGVLDALRGSNLQVSLGVRNEDLTNLASTQTAANSWVQTNVVPYKNNVTFRWITLGNEVIPGSYSTSVAQAMNNIHNALISVGLSTTKVTTVVPMNVLASSYPPSTGAFKSEVNKVMSDIAGFLSRTGAPIMLNAYPYFAYASDPQHISFDYASFNPKQPIVDGSLKYYSLLDAMVDAFHAAMEKISAGNVSITISETGWPTAGNSPYTSKENAQVYNRNLVKRVKNGGTPRRPNQIMDTFIFAMFNENEKPAGVEQNWGLFYPNMNPVYPLF